MTCCLDQNRQQNRGLAPISPCLRNWCLPPRFAWHPVLPLTFYLTLLLALGGSLACAEQPLTIGQVVATAGEQYPSIRVSEERISSAAAAVSLARTSYLPRLDFLAQANRATRNNVFGMLLPQSIIPSISGPPSMTNSLTSVWGSTVGLLATWEPIDFGVRAAKVRTADAGRLRAEAARGRTRFEVSALAADAFLTVLAAQQTLVSAQAGVERSGTVVKVVKSLVDSELRPGADLSRAQAELALAETRVIQSRSAIRVAKASLAQFTGGDPGAMTLIAGKLLDLPASKPLPGESAAQHPAAAEQAAASAEAAAKLRELDRSYYPKFLLQGASYARGTGAIPDGTALGGVNGLGPNIHNWGVGFTATFPILDLPAIRSRRQEEQHLLRAEQAREEQVRRELDAGLQRSNAALEGAWEVAAKTPEQVAAAHATLEQASARYRAGLGTIVDVAEAQRLLTQAETDDSLARLQVWRAMLAGAVAQGDLGPFLQTAAQ